MAITSIPNKTFEHNAWGFQLIKVIEIKTLMPLQAGCRRENISVLQYPFKYPLQKRALPGNIYELALAVFHVFGVLWFIRLFMAARSATRNSQHF